MGRPPIHERRAKGDRFLAKHPEIKALLIEWGTAIMAARRAIDESRAQVFMYALENSDSSRGTGTGRVTVGLVLSLVAGGKCKIV